MTYAATILALSGWLVAALVGVYAWRISTQYEHLKKRIIHHSHAMKIARKLKEDMR